MSEETKQIGIVALAALVAITVLMGGCQMMQARQAATILDMGKAGLCARPGTSNEGQMLNVYYERCAAKTAPEAK